VERFHDPVRTRLVQDIDFGTFLWAVGHAPNWGPVLGRVKDVMQAALLLNQERLKAAMGPGVILIRLLELPEEDRLRLAPVQTITAKVKQGGKGFLVSLRLDCRDEKAAAALNQYLTPPKGDPEKEDNGKSGPLSLLQGMVPSNTNHSVEGRTARLEFPIFRRVVRISLPPPVSDS
jgi:hypothetical protein